MLFVIALRLLSIVNEMLNKPRKVVSVTFAQKVCVLAPYPVLFLSSLTTILPTLVLNFCVIRVSASLTMRYLDPGRIVSEKSINFRRRGHLLVHVSIAPDH
jgi:hypothetical protein